jgi:hypothetical protein
VNVFQPNDFSFDISGHDCFVCQNDKYILLGELNSSSNIHLLLWQIDESQTRKFSLNLYDPGKKSINFKEYNFRIVKSKFFVPKLKKHPFLSLNCLYERVNIHELSCDDWDENSALFDQFAYHAQNVGIMIYLVCFRS